MRDISAVAFYFARQLRAALNRPVGIIVSALGGTKIASWMPRDVLEARAEFSSLLAKPGGEATVCTPHPYESRTPRAADWEAPHFDDSRWPTLSIPGYWQDQGWKHNGAVWYRRSVELPPAWVGRDTALEFGGCDDFDETFVNGVHVGGIGPDSVNAHAVRRVYPVSGTLTTGGRVIIAVRVFDHWGNGGITGDALLRCTQFPGETVALSGPWKACAEKALPVRAAPEGLGLPATVLFNSMIHPLVGCGLRGLLWYQGESDTKCAGLYRLLLPSLISTWRALWNNPSLPFGIVQIANYLEPSPEPVESERAALRDAQLLAARTVPHTGLAVTIDVGDRDIHPVRKEPVGHRLARWALATVYNHPHDGPWSSPLATGHWSDGASVFVRFTHVGNALRARDGDPLQGFQIAGADRRWVWAQAVIVAPDLVRVRETSVAAPVAVRYAWQSNPVCNLENSAGLPASPFRTDDWPLANASSP